MLQAPDIILIVFIVVGLVAVGLFFLNRWAGKKMSDQQSIIERSKTTLSIYVIDKGKVNAKDANLPKAVYEQLPKLYKFMKIYAVKAKIGPQIMTLMCDKKVFQYIPVKKNVKIDLAGIYIVAVKGMKSDKELKEAKKAKKEKKAETEK